MAKDKNTDTEDKEKTEEGASTEEKKEGAAGEGTPAKDDKKKSKKKLFILIGLLVLLIGGGAAAYFSGMIGGGGHGDAEEIKEKPIFYAMPEMIINLAAPGKNASFLKATIILELPHALDAVAVEAELPRLMDAFNTYIRELRPSDLSGSAGITRLREELLLRATKALDPIKVNDVLFKEIVVQ